MSEQKTPRTDSATITNLGKILERKENASYVPVEFARTLERSNAELLEALEDMLSGWKYIRDNHGDLYGVGWERAQGKAESAIAKAKGEA